MNRLQALHDAGVSIWLDTLSRELLDSGEFATLIRPRRHAKCRVRASYYAFGVLLARSPILRFKA